MTLTQEEYEQLKAIKVLYSWAMWVARNKSGIAWCYEALPHRIDRSLFHPFKGNCQVVGKHALPSLTWECEPLNIDKALKNRMKIGDKLSNKDKNSLLMLLDSQHEKFKKFDQKIEASVFKRVKLMVENWLREESETE